MSQKGAVAGLGQEELQLALLNPIPYTLKPYLRMSEEGTVGGLGQQALQLALLELPARRAAHSLRGTEGRCLRPSR